MWAWWDVYMDGSAGFLILARVVFSALHLFNLFSFSL